MTTKESWRPEIIGRNNGAVTRNRGEEMKAIKNYLHTLFTTKTGKTALLGIASTVVAYFQGLINPNEAVVAIFGFIQSVNIRDAVKKVAENAASKPATGGGGTGGGQ